MSTAHEEEIRIIVDAKVKPIYADFIIQVKVQGHQKDRALGNGMVKLLLGQAYEDERKIIHTDTIVIPVSALAVLKELINSKEFEQDYLQSLSSQ